MPQQLALDLPTKPALGREDFFVAPANAMAVAAVEGWRDWPQRKLLLVGPAGAGKTHLAHVWAAGAEARVMPAARLRRAEVAALVKDSPRLALEDAEAVAGDEEAEAALFHLHNLILAEGGHLLLTAAAPPAEWGLALPDLASRLQGTPLARLEPPDDALLSAVLLKLFADRQLAVDPELIGYLVPRMERSFEAARRLVEALDREALARRRRITRNLAATLLDNPGRGHT